MMNKLSGQPDSYDKKCGFQPLLMYESLQYSTEGSIDSVAPWVRALMELCEKPKVVGNDLPSKSF